jgi:hypothetical protein
MKSKKTLMVLAALLIMVLSTAGIAGAITFGKPDGDAHPYVGLLIFDDEDGPAWRCTGTLVGPKVVLTASHCTEGAVAARIWFDEKLRDEDGKPLVPDYPEGGAVAIEGTPYSHPDYWWGPTSNPRDVGVVILEEAVTDVGLANLPYEGFLDDLREAGDLNQGKEKARFTLVGYGGTLDWPPPVISYDLMRRFSVSEHRALLKAWLRMSQNQATGDGGTCYGDSGGPAFWTDPLTGVETLVGITSWGDAVCVASAFNYRVDIPETLDFLADMTTMAEGE